MPDTDPDPDDLLAPAEALAAMLRGETTDDEDDWRVAAIAKLTGIDIIVKRQGDIDAMIAAAVGKAKGAAILISLEGWSEGPEDNGTPILPLRHSISLWTKPIMRKGAIAESIALGALVRAIHGWVSDPQTSDDGMYRWRVGAGDSGQALTKSNQTLNIYEFAATFEVVL